MEKGDNRSWNPYLAGALTGILLILSVWIAGKFFGASTSFVRTAGMIEKIFSAERVGAMDYFTKYVPQIDWQWMFVFGIFLGALISSLTSGTFRWQGVPNMWQSRFGSSVGKRAIIAFIGGAIAIFGARLAGGCPSGHGLSGLTQLSISGFVALICFFLAGMIMARILYGGEKT